MNRYARRLCLLAVALLLVCTIAPSAWAQGKVARRALGTAAEPSVILGRPTESSVAMSVLLPDALDTRVEYGSEAGEIDRSTPWRQSQSGVPFEIEITGLQQDTHYGYRLILRKPDTQELQVAVEGSFQTQRRTGSSFTFALQGDSHPEREGRMFDAELYTQTLRNVAKDSPDFYITMGDDFSIERLISDGNLTQPAVDQVYMRQRSFLGLVGQSAFLFLVNGNHEQAALSNLDGTPNNAAVLAGIARTRFFPLPIPGGIYGGNVEEIPYVGLPRDYYSWTWGDALFVVIDPYWHSKVTVDNPPGGGHRGGGGGNKSRGRDMWGITLGDVQYQWLVKTLKESQAQWKFVFCHHVLGTGRGGVELAGLCEWGGRDRNGAWLFAEKRPGWELPIHQLMSETGVTIFFQGHDHLYAHQVLDGVVYQTCPNPADPTYQAFNRDAYRSGETAPNSGHLRVNVSPDSVKVDYVRSFVATQGVEEQSNGSVVQSYTVAPKQKGEAR